MKTFAEKDPRFLAEVMLLSQHPEDFKGEEIHVRMLEAQAGMAKCLGEQEEAAWYTKLAHRTQAIVLSARQSTKAELS